MQVSSYDTEIKALEGHVKTVEKLLNEANTTKNIIEKELTKAMNELKKAAEEAELRQKLIHLYRKASEYARGQMRTTIETIVTNALNVVFSNDDLSFSVEFDIRAGAPTAEFFVIERGYKTPISGPMAGGYKDVVSMALRLAVLSLCDPQIKGPLLLDEPGKQISAEHRESFAFFLKEYAKSTGRQIIMITHDPVFAVAADVEFNITKENGVSKVRRIQRGDML